MRPIILVAGVALSLAACGNNDQADNTQNVDENLTAENIVSNDVTAIDAVTGDAANMAADMDVNFTNGVDNELGNAVTSAPPASRSPATQRSTTETPTTNESSGNESANVADE